MKSPAGVRCLRNNQRCDPPTSSSFSELLRTHNLHSSLSSGVQSRTRPRRQRFDSQCIQVAQELPFLPQARPLLPVSQRGLALPSQGWGSHCLGRTKINSLLGSQGLLKCCFGQGGEIKKLAVWRSGTSYCSL